MLTTTKLVNKVPAEQFIQLWAARYIPDLSTLVSEGGNRYTVSDLVEAASPEGRAKTSAKLVQRLIQLKCECAEIKKNALFSYIPNVVDLIEAGRIAEYAARVYEKTLFIYQQQSPPNFSLAAIPLTATLDAFSDRCDSSRDILMNRVMPALELPAIEQLAMALAPALLQLRQQHLSANDPRTVGFLTTQFHFSTKLILNGLTLPEQVLLSPYFKFVEEQVCIPWQRVCNAAALHAVDSPAINLVQQLLPASPEIASAVFYKAKKLYSDRHSRRGGLSNRGVKASTMRDLEMFQSYLWLCVLENSMKVMEQELLPLCVMVFPSVDVTWELVRSMLSLLVDEIMERLASPQKRLLLPYTQAMQQMFHKVATQAVLS